MSLFSSSARRSSTKLIWRIDSASISVTLISTATQKIHYYDSHPIMLLRADDRDLHEQLLHHTELCMTRMLPALQAALDERPHESMVILGEPWAHSIRRTMTYKRKTQFKLTKSFIDDLVERDMKRLTQQQTSLHRQAITLMAPIYHDMRVGGHSRINIIGNIINDITFDYFTGFSDKDIVGIATRINHEKLKVSLLNIHIDHYQNYVMRFWQKVNPTSGLVIDLSGFVTDLYIFQNGSMVQTGTLPSGLSGIREKLSSVMGLYPGELSSLLGLYQKNLVDESTYEKLSTLMNGQYTLWEKDFQKFCHHAVAQGDILDHVIWSGDQHDPLLQFFMHAVSSNTIQFPLVFGASRVGFMHVDVLLAMMDQGMNEFAHMNYSDRIILAGDNHK